MHRIFITVVAAGLLASACTIQVERNEDGSLQVETTITEASLESEIEAAIGDSLVGDISIDMRSEYLLVDTERYREDREGSVSLSFRVDLFVEDGHLGAAISEATLDGQPVADDLVGRWNDRLAKGLDRAGRRHPNSTLIDVTITGSELLMEWHVETPRSRG
jgi:hypothetical protein